MTLASFDIHGARPVIRSEYPENHLSITVAWTAQITQTVYFDVVDDWWAFRKCFPRSSGYAYHRMSLDSIRDHGDADREAARFMEMKSTENAA
jgi:hypothetical protein